MKDFIDALHISVTVWLFFEWYRTQKRLDAAGEALRHIGALVMIIGGGKPPEKP